MELRSNVSTPVSIQDASGITIGATTTGGAKGATAAAVVTSTAEGADHQALDVQVYHGGTAVNPTAIRALTSADVVTPALGTLAFNTSDTNVAAGTRRTLPAAGVSFTIGFFVTNTHASATVFFGVAASVSSTVFIHRLAPGQSTPLVPVTPTTVFGWDTDTTGATIAIGGY